MRHDGILLEPDGQAVLDFGVDRGDEEEVTTMVEETIMEKVQTQVPKMENSPLPGHSAGFVHAHKHC